MEQKSANEFPGEITAISPEHVRDFLAFLAIQRKVSASTQNQTFNSLLTFFRLVFNTELGDLKHAVRARTGKRLPVVFSLSDSRDWRQFERLEQAEAKSTLLSGRRWNDRN